MQFVSFPCVAMSVESPTSLTLSLDEVICFDNVEPDKVPVELSSIFTLIPKTNSISDFLAAVQASDRLLSLTPFDVPLLI